MAVKIASPAYDAEGLAIAVRKGDHELLETLNRLLAEIKADGTLDAIYAKWFGTAPRF